MGTEIQMSPFLREIPEMNYSFTDVFSDIYEEENVCESDDSVHFKKGRTCESGEQIHYKKGRNCESEQIRYEKDRECESEDENHYEKERKSLREDVDCTFKSASALLISDSILTESLRKTSGEGNHFGGVEEKERAQQANISSYSDAEEDFNNTNGVFKSASHYISLTSNTAEIHSNLSSETVRVPLSASTQHHFANTSTASLSKTEQHHFPVEEFTQNFLSESEKMKDYGMKIFYSKLIFH
jgi:hypothetical protein